MYKRQFSRFSRASRIPESHQLRTARPRARQLYHTLVPAEAAAAQPAAARAPAAKRARPRDADLEEASASGRTAKAPRSEPLALVDSPADHRTSPSRAPGRARRGCRGGATTQTRVLKKLLGPMLEMASAAQLPEQRESR